MRYFALFLLVGVVSCARTTPETGAWDPAATASLEAEPEAMLKDIDAGNFDAMIAKMDSGSVAFDYDEKNNPVRIEGAENIRKFFDGYGKMMKEQQMKLTSTPVSKHCQATASMGYCALEFDQSMTANGQTMGPFKFRGTLVARRDGAGWKWVHWHGSFRELPAAPSAPKK